MRQIARHAEDSHIDLEFVMVAARLFQQAMNVGYGREEVSALFKVLQRGEPRLLTLDSRLGGSALTNENAARCCMEGRHILLAPMKFCLPVLDSGSE